MSRSEFRWNKKRKHYAYLHKDLGSKRKNVLISSKSFVKGRPGKKNLDNIPLYHHPDANKEGQYYVVPRNYLDDSTSFEEKIYDWKWDKNDKRKIKRIKKISTKNKKAGYEALFQQITDTINISILTR